MYLVAVNAKLSCVLIIMIMAVLTVENEFKILCICNFDISIFLCVFLKELCRNHSSGNVVQKCLFYSIFNAPL
jgi:hypothetical protein